MRVVKIIGIALGALSVIAVAIGLWAWSICQTSYDAESAVRIYIPVDASTDDIADTLRTHLNDKMASATMRIYSAMDANPKAAYGSYLVQPGTTALDLGRMLRYHRQTPVRLTFNNIRTLNQLSDRVANTLDITPQAFLAATDSVLSAKDMTRAQAPAAFIPDTYEFYWTAKPADVVSRLYDYRQRFWTDSRLSQARSLGLTPTQVTTIASIVEEESAKTDEWPVIARLYLNRYNRGMKLQADPTVKFAVGDFGLRRITSAHLAKQSPYNTYLVEGLPPGPIRIPSKAAIDAVLSAPNHNYLYMCAKEDLSGYHNFTADYNTHLQNARRYRDMLNRRGIK